MTEERLQRIRQTIKWIEWNERVRASLVDSGLPADATGRLGQFVEMARELLAEVEQSREIVRKLLDIADLAEYYAPGELGEHPELMRESITKARALLAE